MLRWLGHVLWMKDDKLLKFLLVGQPSTAIQKVGRPRMAWKDILRKDLRDMVTSWEGVKREALNKLR